VFLRAVAVTASDGLPLSLKPLAPKQPFRDLRAEIFHEDFLGWTPD
jgi:hypothetical protein